MKLVKDPWTFLDRLPTAMQTVGSPEHKDFALHVRAWQGERTRAEMTMHVMGVLLDGFEKKGLNHAMAISTMRDMTPFIVGSGQWAELGYPSITLTHDFYRAIAVTDFGEVGAEPMHMPFPTFLIRLPESLRGQEASTPLFLYPVATKTVVVRKGDLRPPAYASEKDAEIESAEVGFDVTRMAVTSEPDEDPDVRGSWTQWENGVPYNRFLTGKVESIEERDPLEAAVTSALNQSFDPELTKRARRVLANTLLYINANDGLPAAKKVGPEVAVEREHNTEPRFRVGRPIKLGATLKAAIREGLRGSASWKLLSRFYVRGHWRNQAYGPEYSLHRKRWIWPFWKGPEDMGEALERTFEVT